MLQVSKNNLRAFFLLIVILTFDSCEKDESTPAIIGNWTSTGFSSDSKAYLLGIKDSSIFVSSGVLYRTTDDGNNWTALYNPYNSLNGKCFHTNGNNIFLGFVDEIFMSNDNGNNWSLIGSNLSGTVNALASIDSTIYVGTLCGVHATVNNLYTWTNIYSGFPVSNSSYPYLETNDLAVKDNNLFAATYGVYLYNQQNSSWSSVSNGLPLDIVTSLAISGNTIFASTWNHGVYFSNNNGSSWTEKSKGLPQNNGLEYYQIQSITAFGNYIFAVVKGHIYLSTINGNSWTIISGFPATNDIQTSVAVKDNILYCGGGYVIDPDVYHPQTVGQIWKCDLNSLHSIPRR